MEIVIDARRERKDSKIRIPEGNSTASTHAMGRRSPSAIEPAAALPRRVTAVELFAGARELRIAHAGEEYRLNITRSGKLILTK